MRFIDSCFSDKFVRKRILFAPIKMAASTKQEQLSAHRFKFSLFLIIAELIFLCLFGSLVRYGEDAGKAGSEGANSGDKLNNFYPMFQDVHVMIFVGFGFLMLFLKNYGFSAVSYNFLLAAFIIQYSILVGGFVNMAVQKIDGQKVSKTIDLTVETLFDSDFACAAVLISFGAVLGKLSAFQLLIMATFEVIWYKVNSVIGDHYLKAADMGGSMFVHVFGAYFGLVLSRVISRETQRERPTEGSDYRSDLFSMVGTTFLFVYWPSFNSALAADEERVRSVLNTYIALCASCVATFAVSALNHSNGKVTMAHVQNATLAGGVAVGTCCNMMIHPVGAMAIGLGAGIISTLGFARLQGFLGSLSLSHSKRSSDRLFVLVSDTKLGLHDTCGVNNLHGMPGIFAGVCGIAFAGLASNEIYGDVSRVFTDFDGGEKQALRQAGALGATVAMAAVGGLTTGLFLRYVPTSDLRKHQNYNDTDFWNDVAFEGLNESISLINDTSPEQEC